jgi:hypothetical protein
MRKLRTRILVGAAVATFAGTAAFAAVSTADASTAGKTVAMTTTAAQADASTAKTATALSIAERKATITSGQWDVIRGRLTTASTPTGRRVVELDKYNPTLKKWQVVRMKLTGKAGRIRFAVRPLATSEYEIVYHGNTKLAASRSNPITVTVTG